MSAGPAGPALSRPLGCTRWLALRGWFRLKVNKYRAKWVVYSSPIAAPGSTARVK